MTFKTPAFWYGGSQPVGVRGAFLTALESAYSLGLKLRGSVQNRSFRASIPVLCVGNLVAGGSGKTPAALAVMRLLRERGLTRAPFFLTRGYGGRLKGPIRVLDDMCYPGIGDEALLLVREAPVIVSADRAAGLKLAEEQGADLVVMDDGFQNLSVWKDLSFLVVDGGAGFGNGRLLPAGPLRESLEQGFARADGIFLSGEDCCGVSQKLPEGKPVWRASLESAGTLPERPFFAFAGLGRPEKFFAFLKEQGVRLAGTQAFSDHHPYSESDMSFLESRAQAVGASLLTTEKDAVRIPAGHRASIHTFPVRLRFSDEDALSGFLEEALRRIRV